MRGEKKEYKCQCCKEPFQARTADRKRGWARFCSKRCKAIRQTQQRGHFIPEDNFIQGAAEDGK